MRKDIKWKLSITFALILISIIYLYPTFKWVMMNEKEREKAQQFNSNILKKILKLGLDLKGGMHLILEVEMDKLSADVKEQDAIDRAKEIIRNRVDQLGVSEPQITQQGDHWIVVQLPGIDNPKQAIDLIGKTALLEFKLVNDKVQIADLLNEEGEIDENKIPEGYEIVKGKEDTRFLLKKEAGITGAYLTNAQVKIGGQYNLPYVALSFNSEGAKIFSKLTEQNVERRLAIVLDNVVQSAPVIRTRIPDGRAIIEGNFSMEEAKNLAIVLRAGALPAPVRIIENRLVGPTLGRDSVKAGITATIIGFVAVLIFMLFYYRLAGIIADIALFLNLFLLLGAMVWVPRIMGLTPFTLTLPGIAGIILTIGMAVDANVLIFERIKEEIKTGKTIYASIDAGYQRAFRTILDANITTLLAALFLFQFGTGPIKGFAVTLTLGIGVSMFTAIIVTHTIFDLILSGKKVERLSI